MKTNHSQPHRTTAPMAGFFFAKGCSAAALLFLTAFSQGGFAEETAALQERLPPALKVERMEVTPAKIELTDVYGHRQVLVTGITSSGDRVDLTRMCKIDGGDGIVAVSEQGGVRPVANGSGELTFAFGGNEVSIAVSVNGQEVPRDVSYIQDIMPTMSKLGCNQGTCHGAAQGKNGFKLSLRGYDPLFDHRALTDDLQGRRFNRAAPDRSLFLLKVSGGTPHVGGLLTRPGEAYYDLLRTWVATGVKLDLDAPRVTRIHVQPQQAVLQLPGMRQQITVEAEYEDGRRRDVTAESFFEGSDIEVVSCDKTGLVEGLRRGEAAVLVRYEGRYAAAPVIVMGDRSEFEWQEVPEYNYIDTLVYKKLRTTKTLASDVCTDAEFIRRLYIDLIGIPPESRDVRTFLVDARDSREKRAELIDRLIGSAEFVEHWTNKWADLLQVNRKFLGEDGATVLRDWVHQAVASNRPYNDFVHSILTAEGSTLENPPAAYFKVLRNAEDVMENTTQLFLGVRFSCNKCHDHPFERWTQDNYWELSSFFAQVGRKNAEGSPIMPRQSATQTKKLAFEEVIFDKKEGEITPPTGKSVYASFPYPVAHEASSDSSRRQQLASWLTSSKNPYFAKSYVNRLWSYFLGKGFIDPIDDIRAGNPPSNPELLDRLTQEFLDSEFDTRHIMRLILNSRTYQHSIRTNKWNEDDEVNFSHAAARRLTAEMLYDAIHLATGSRTHLPGMRTGSRAAELLDSSVKLNDGFLDLFGKPPRESACECERSGGMSLGQSLSLINGPTVANAIRDPDNLIANLIEVESDDKKVIEELFLAFLGRFPTADEKVSLVETLEPAVRANLESLTDTELQVVLGALDDWEKEVNLPDWVALEPDFVRSSAGATLTALEDHSILASGENPETDTYTVVGSTRLQDLTGFRIEVLPDESLPKLGPGRADDARFRLSEVSMVAVPLDATRAAAPVTFQNATARLGENGRRVDRKLSQAIDGKNDPNNGWEFVDDDAGTAAFAVFEVKKEADETAEEKVDGDADEKKAKASTETLLTVTMDQLAGGKKTIGRFRLWVTSTPAPVRALTVPKNIASVLYIAKDKRTPEQADEIFTYFMKVKPEYANMIRRSAAQDIAWALVNSPAFLFNR